ncbi:hypothetical protein Ciccas_010423 [Cichlidogyrus casuarinus]|uniref:Uncharacterized protein n=1 Tax=Cichlidogyrus casuarinus TaxID=1844966 RepID=A0ABD2PVT9_9PLAT
MNKSILSIKYKIQSICRLYLVLVELFWIELGTVFKFEANLDELFEAACAGFSGAASTGKGIC